MSDAPKLLITLDGVEYKLGRRDISAVDAQDFRAKVGVPLSGVLQGVVASDIDVAAGLVWLVRRKKERGLPFETVARDITYDTTIDITETTDAAKDLTDPET